MGVFQIIAFFTLTVKNNTEHFCESITESEHMRKLREEWRKEWDVRCQLIYRLCHSVLLNLSHHANYFKCNGNSIGVLFNILASVSVTFSPSLL